MAVPLNFWAIIVSAIAMFALGWLWYGPLFGKKWMSLSNITPDMVEKAKQKSMMGSMVLMFVGSLVMAFTLKHNLVFGSAYLNMYGVSAGMQAAFWNWLGFIAPVTMGKVLWEGKSWSLWILDNAYYLVSLLIMGSILACWL